MHPVVFRTAPLYFLIGLLVTCLPNARGESAPLWAIQGQPAASASKSSLRLEDGTPVKLRLTRTVSSASAQTDERVDFEVLEEIKVGDIVVIPKGAVALATVTEAAAKKRMARGGKLNMTVDSVRLADGEKAALRGIKEMKGGGSTGAMTGAMVATSLIVWPAAPFFLFMHGKDVTIPKGTEVTVYVNGDMTLDPAKFGAKLANEAPAAAPAVATAAPSGSPQVPGGPPVAGELSVIFKSTPSGADISIDNNYVGSTPSTVRVPAGEHVITIEKSGFKSWKRSMALRPGGEITVDAGLEKGP